MFEELVYRVTLLSSLLSNERTRVNNTYACERVVQFSVHHALHNDRPR